MSWNLGNGLLVIGCLLLGLASTVLLLRHFSNQTARYLNFFLLTAALTIVQVLLIDAGFLQVHPGLGLLYMPWQFAGPVLFTAFTCSYLDRKWVFKRWRWYLYTPFLIYTLIYTIIKINGALGFPWFSSREVLYFSSVWDEHLAVAMGLLVGIWNYRIIKRYEKTLVKLPHVAVQQKTYWLRLMFTLQIILLVAWVLVIIYLHITKYERSMAAYYPLWFLFLVFYGLFGYLGNRHLKEKELYRHERQKASESILADFQKRGLEPTFPATEWDGIVDNSKVVTGILGYFATSLFDKQSESEVLWNIVQNAIGQLDLEDCVIYLLDKRRGVLEQKAAYGHKAAGGRKILSPIEIPVGEGIVGYVAQHKTYCNVPDLSQEKRYIVDDKARSSELAVPICYEDELYGVLDSEHSQTHFFTDQHVLLFQLIAKLTATKLHHLQVKDSRTLTDDNVYYKELCWLMEKEKMYRDPDLNLTKVAGRLQISATYLSQLINTISEYNFSDFTNAYRIQEAQRLLTHPHYQAYPILSIGLESGFNSRSAFYAAFKKFTGVSPSVYRAKAPYVS